MRSVHMPSSESFNVERNFSIKNFRWIARAVCFEWKTLCDLFLILFNWRCFQLTLSNDGDSSNGDDGGRHLKGLLTCFFFVWGRHNSSLSIPMSLSRGNGKIAVTQKTRIKWHSRNTRRLLFYAAAFENKRKVSFQMVSVVCGCTLFR